eukprot:36968_1
MQHEIIKSELPSSAVLIGQNITMDLQCLLHDQNIINPCQHLAFVKEKDNNNNVNYIGINTLEDEFIHNASVPVSVVYISSTRAPIPSFNSNLNNCAESIIIM